MIRLLIYDDLSIKQQGRLKREGRREHHANVRHEDMTSKADTRSPALGSSGLVSALGLSSADLCVAIFLVHPKLFRFPFHHVMFDSELLHSSPRSSLYCILRNEKTSSQVLLPFMIYV